MGETKEQPSGVSFKAEVLVPVTAALRMLPSGEGVGRDGGR